MSNFLFWQLQIITCNIRLCMLHLSKITFYCNNLVNNNHFVYFNVHDSNACSFTSLVRKNVKNNSIPLSPSCTSFTDKHPKFMSSSNHLTSNY